MHRLQKQLSDREAEHAQQMERIRKQLFYKECEQNPAKARKKTDPTKNGQGE